MNNKVEHKITWTVNTIKPKRTGIVGKLAEMLGHTKADVHTYIMDIHVASQEDDSIDSALESIMRQLKNISTSDAESTITAHNGISRTQFIRSDMV